MFTPVLKALSGVIPFNPAAPLCVILFSALHISLLIHRRMFVTLYIINSSLLHHFATPISPLQVHLAEFQSFRLAFLLHLLYLISGTRPFTLFILFIHFEFIFFPLDLFIVQTFLKSPYWSYTYTSS